MPNVEVDWYNVHTWLNQHSTAIIVAFVTCSHAQSVIAITTPCTAPRAGCINLVA